MVKEKGDPYFWIFSEEEMFLGSPLLPFVNTHKKVMLKALIEG